MIQTSKYHWQIVSPSGTIMQSELYLSSMDKARDYIRSYVSSYTTWTYELIPLAL